MGVKVRLETWELPGIILYGKPILLLDKMVLVLLATLLSTRSTKISI